MDKIQNLYEARVATFRVKLASLSIATILVLCFVCIISFSVRNFISSRISLDIYSPSLMGFDDEELLAEIHVKKGDTLKKILVEQRISNADIDLIMKSLKNAKIKTHLKPGDIISCDYINSPTASDDENPELLDEYILKKLNISLSDGRNIIIARDGGLFIADEVKAKLVIRCALNTIPIDGSFASSLIASGVSSKNVQEIINAYSHKIDFQRQIKNGDSIKVLSEKIYSDDGRFINNGKVLYALLNLSGQKHEIYFFKLDKNHTGEYYSENGQSAKRSLLRTPINSSRISSKFGKRYHPVHGFTQMHKGVDFSAPRGTPILAAGDGIIKEIGYRGAYGNLVKIKHNAAVSTVYAHASKFASNLKIGSKVKQGQIIAYVGNTGRATGPHCHFEVLVNGKHVNPMSMHTAPDNKLTKNSLALFDQNKNKIRSLVVRAEAQGEIELSDNSKFSMSEK
ncbi:MAG: M23 family metallopeptidase [Rickettsiaceae bacterium]|nr:M23 family metallopeptidase [Rickettsiaceae bacterium]